MFYGRRGFAEFCKVTALAATALGLAVQPLAAYEKTGPGTIVFPPNGPGPGSTADSSVIIIGDPGNPTPPVLTPPLSWLYHTFTGTNGDGATPVSLVEAGDGYLYGTTAAGGAANAGTLFRINPGATTLQTPVHLTLHSFDGAAGGSAPTGSLARASDGMIYGVTSGGGAYGKGTLFKRDPSGTVSVVHSFGAPADETHQAEAVYPITIMLASDGNIYGLARRPVSSPGIIILSSSSTTFAPSAFNSSLTLFKVTPEGAISYSGSFVSPFQFSLFPSPPPSIIEAREGKFYVSVDGRVYPWSAETPDANALALPSGVAGIGNLVRTHAGVIYGTVFKSGSAVIARIDPLTDSITELSAVFRDIAPHIEWTPPVQTFGQLNPPGSVITLSFQGGPVSLIEGGNGALYGLWSQPGGTDYIFSVLLDGTFGTDIVHKFSAAEGRTPGTLVRAGGSKLAGVLGSSASLTSKGTIFAFYPVIPKANIPPIAVGDRFEVTDVPNLPPGAPRTLTAHVLANDTDGDQDTLRVISAASDAGDPVFVGPTGAISTTYNETSAPPVVTYKITDDRGGEATGKIVLQNAPPKARPDTLYIPAGQDYPLNVTDNDSDPDGDSLRVLKFTQPRHGKLELRSDYTLVYKSKAGFSEDRFEYTISDGHGGRSDASVRVVNSIAKLKGEYRTFIGQPNTIGSIQLSVTLAGAFTGKLNFGATSYRIRGKFLPDGTYTIVLPGENGRPLELSLQYFLEGGKTTISGFLGDELPDGRLHESRFSVRRAASVTETPLAGRYTLVFPTPMQLTSASPKGNGYAVMTIGSRGAATISGRLGDGVPFSAGSQLLANGTLPLYARAYATSNWAPGGLTGSFTFASIKDVSDVSGTFSWFKPPVTGGIKATVSAVGSRYTPPDPTRQTSKLWKDGAMLHMGDGGLSDNIKKRVTVLSATQLEVAPVGTEQVHLSLQPSTGLLSGEFTHPSNGKTSQIGGVVLQKQDRAFGAFAAPDGTGWITIEPRD